LTVAAKSEGKHMARRRKPPDGRVRPVLACVALAAVLVIGDAAAVRAYPIAGLGFDSCGRWTEDGRKSDPRHILNPGGITHLGQQQWVLGYLSAVAATGPGQGYDPLNNTDAEGVFAWIDHYCRDHPLEQIAAAAAAFVTAHPH
jgi:hypothetical protein